MLPLYCEPTARHLSVMQGEGVLLRPICRAVHCAHPHSLPDFLKLACLGLCSQDSLLTSAARLSIRGTASSALSAHSIRRDGWERPWGVGSGGGREVANGGLKRVSLSATGCQSHDCLGPLFVWHISWNWQLCQQREHLAKLVTLNERQVYRRKKKVEIEICYLATNICHIVNGFHTVTEETHRLTDSLRGRLLEANDVCEMNSLSCGNKYINK